MIKKIVFTSLSAFFSMSAFAADPIYDQEFPLVWQSVITLNGGAAWANPGVNQYLYPILPFFVNQPQQVAYFINKSNTGALFTGEAFFGLQRLIQPGLVGQLGIGVAGASDAKLKGVVNINNVIANTYEYKVNHALVELKGKLISTTYNIAQPYLSAGFGAGYNDSHDYIPTTINPNIYPASWFQKSTTIAFTYTLGAGVQTVVTPNWRVGIGYEFSDWGKSSLGGDGASLTKGPGLAHLYTNELLFSVSYLFSDRNNM